MAESIRLTARPLGPANPIERFRRTARGRDPFFLDSSLRDTELARYSYLGANPIGWFRSRGRQAAFATPWGDASPRGDPIEALRSFLELLPTARIGRPPYPFPGGLVGYLSYDLGRSVEPFPSTKAEDLEIPDIHLALYPDVVVIDHVWGEAYAVGPRDPIRFDPRRVPQDLAVPRDPRGIEPLDREAYIRTIEVAKEHIADGEIFQVNLSHRIALPLDGSPPAAYERLRERTPSTFGGYLDAGDHRILSASPERFLRVAGREIETRPIKGTRPRDPSPSEDRRLAEELLASEKDAAENVMIVDLERNDLGKVCEFGTVAVPVLRGLRSLPTVHHLESVVRGRLRPGVGLPDLLRATFPGGSITGAPKPRAMEIIERLEPHRRGVYTGAMGYVAWDGTMDLNIAIRTATVIGPTAHFAVGGGIVADSDPRAEYRETMDKLRGHAEALTHGRLEVTPDGLRVG
ncbi:MAG TPA: aminodeoxychorismate synthase component I [Thermoplasmata archaeon]|nr:aminodeoxychorismate synthase component I [Thermoplasmata archaeon]